jgi:hypothetical protein
MKQLLLYSIITLFGISCSCEWHAKRISAKCSSESISDSTSVSTEENVKIKDTTIYITEKGPTQWLPNPCKHLCDSMGNLKPFKEEKKKNGLTGRIETHGNVLTFDCDADSLKARIKYLEKQLSRKEVRKSEKKTVVTIRELNWFDRFCHWFFYICAGFGIGVIYFKLRKKISLRRLLK